MWALEYLFPGVGECLTQIKKNINRPSLEPDEYKQLISLTLLLPLTFAVEQLASWLHNWEVSGPNIFTKTKYPG
jgi:hypothetical protein